MKKIKINKKLSLNKEKISILNERDAMRVAGGNEKEYPKTYYIVCATGCVCYTSIGPSCGIYCGPVVSED